MQGGSAQVALSPCCCAILGALIATIKKYEKLVENVLTNGGTRCILTKLSRKGQRTADLQHDGLDCSEKKCLTTEAVSGILNKFAAPAGTRRNTSEKL